MNIDNIVMLTGIVGKPVALNQAGTIGSVNIAVRDTGKDKNGNYTTSWITLKFLGEKNAKAAEKYLDKGVKVRVVGELDVKSVKGNDGKWANYTNVNVITWRIENNKGGQDSSSDSNSTSQDNSMTDGGFVNVSSDMGSDFLPFA